jgi:hypothetical protein
MMHVSVVLFRVLDLKSCSGKQAGSAKGAKREIFVLRSLRGGSAEGLADFTGSINMLDWRAEAEPLPQAQPVNPKQGPALVDSAKKGTR